MSLQLWLALASVFLAFFGLRYAAARQLELMRCHNKALTNQVFMLIDQCTELQAELDKARAAVLAAKEQMPPQA